MTPTAERRVQCRDQRHEAHVRHWHDTAIEQCATGRSERSYADTLAVWAEAAEKWVTFRAENGLPPLNDHPALAPPPDLATFGEQAALRREIAVYADLSRYGDFAVKVTDALPGDNVLVLGNLIVVARQKTSEATVGLIRGAAEAAGARAGWKLAPESRHKQFRRPAA